MNLKKEITKNTKNLVKKFWSSKQYGDFMFATDYSVASKFSRNSLIAGRKKPLILAPDGNGNIGDQAMFDSLIKNISGELSVIVNNEFSLKISPENRKRIDLIVLPSLIRGLIHNRGNNLLAFAEAVRNASVFIIPGADTMDGGHPHASLSRLSLANIASEFSVPVAIVGFSWSNDIPESVLNSMRLVSKKALLNPRDPLSAERLEKSGVSNVCSSSDLVFSYWEQTELPEYIEKWIQNCENNGDKFAIINNSGLIRRKNVIDDEYQKTIKYLHDEGIKILFLPHVIREPDNDLFACKEIFKKFAAEDDLLVTDLLLPSQIKAITPRAIFTVTGRMHLAIMSLSHGTMPITMATAGKVEGLYQLFNLPYGVVQPKEGCGNALLEQVQKVYANYAELSDYIEGQLPRVKELSSFNWNILNIAETNG